MHLENIQLFNFKNHEELNLSFSPSINCIVGNNGVGKTALLDAIYFLTMGKSALIALDNLLIMHDQQFLMAKGLFSKNDSVFEILGSFKRLGKKVFKNNQVPYEKISEHIGKFPVVFISPEDTELIHGGSEMRRKFMDVVISQFSAEYLQDLIKYNKILKQRNSLLKVFYDTGKKDFVLLDTYDLQLSELIFAISRERMDFIAGFSVFFQDAYLFLTKGKEKVELIFKAGISDDPLADFKSSRQKDCVLQRTTKGIHRDDLELVIDDYPLKKFGSQGQQKSFVIAMQLAKFKMIEGKVNFKPILLLDDIFDKLDDHRILNLLKMVEDLEFGQVFLTDAREERTKKVFEFVNTDYKIIKIEDEK